MRDDGCLSLEHFRASPDNEGFMVIREKEEVDIYQRLEARVRLELGCVAQCVVIDLEGDRRGVILSLECEYDSHGGPSDQLSAPAKDWFLSASWELSTVTEVMTNIREDGGIKHCIQVSAHNSFNSFNWLIFLCFIQAGIDRANQSASCPSQWIDKWEVKATCLSYLTGEISQAQAQVNRDLFLSRYQTQIAQLFSNR